MSLHLLGACFHKKKKKLSLEAKVCRVRFQSDVCSFRVQATHTESIQTRMNKDKRSETRVAVSGKSTQTCAQVIEQNLFV